MRVQKGFTLIEIMITITVIAILSAIAIPSYTDYMRRARITEATSALANMQVKFEQFFQDNRTYAGACLPGTVAVRPVDTLLFTYLCPVLNLQQYTITATGVPGSAMANFTFQMSMAPATGVVRSTTSVPTGWATSATCWVLKKDGTC